VGVVREIGMSVRIDIFQRRKSVSGTEFDGMVTWWYGSINIGDRMKFDKITKKEVIKKD